MSGIRGLELSRPGVVAGRALQEARFWRRAVRLGLRAGPWAAVGATVAWSLWELRATVLPAAFGNDSSVHEQMVRFATAQLRAGHDPLTSWFPYLGLGSPQFLHYQSLPAMLTGLAGLVVGPDIAFRWSLYLLWCLWPMAIYASARVLRLRRWAAALAAVVAPLLHSVPGVGYEQHAYLWIGYGVWTQLWGAWALPFAWALTWRAVADKRFLAPAAALVALTAAFHFETGYLAFAAVVIMPFLIRAGLRARVLRAGVLLAAALLACGWVVLPLLRYSRWAGINQALAGTPLVNGYGAGRTLGWLVTGRVFDDGHLPVITLLVAAGLAAVAARWRQAGPGRALAALLCLGLLLSFGRTTFGGLASIIPGSTDLFFRRFLMGAQLAGIYLAGLGGAEAARLGRRVTARCAGSFTRHRLGWLAWLPASAMILAGLAWLVPAWRYFHAYDARNSAGIHAQVIAQRKAQPQIVALDNYLRRHGGGRAYAGSPGSGGRYFAVGYVPMYAYLESQDVSEVGYTLRTASLMTQPEYHFDPGNPGDYALFGIRYLILPALGKTPPKAPGLVLRTSRFWVFKLAGDGYFRVADTVGRITANRADVGSQSAAYLRSRLLALGGYLTVAYDGARPAAPTVRPGMRLHGPAGVVVAHHANLGDGTASAIVVLRRRAVVVLSASFDPGWSVTVDGRPAATEMIAPALVGVTVPPGQHDITFRYTGFGGYPPLLAIAAASLLALTIITRSRRSWCWPLAAGRRPQAACRRPQDHPATLKKGIKMTR